MGCSRESSGSGRVGVSAIVKDLKLRIKYPVGYQLGAILCDDRRKSSTRFPGVVVGLTVEVWSLNVQRGS